MVKLELENKLILMAGYARGGIDISEKIIELADQIKEERRIERHERQMAIMNRLTDEEMDWNPYYDERG